MKVSNQDEQGRVVAHMLEVIPVTVANVLSGKLFRGERDAALIEQYFEEDVVPCCSRAIGTTCSVDCRTSLEAFIIWTFLW